MNLPYIPHSISAHLHTLVRGYPKSGKNIPELFSTIRDFSDGSIGGLIIASNAAKEASSMPLILSVEDEFAYALVKGRRRDYLIGPVRFDEPVYFRKTLTMNQLNIPKGQFTADWIQSVPLCSFDDFSEQVLLLFNCRRSGNAKEPFLRRRELVAANCVRHEIMKKSREKTIEQILENMENEIVHNPYSQEQREMSSIRGGDIESLRQAIQEDFTGQYGRLSKNPLRQEKDMGIVTITLASRAAIEGGLHHETAFNISDMTIQQIESAGDVQSVKHFYREAEYYLANLVHNLNQKKKAPAIENRHVSRCKDYIMTHLHQKLTVTQVAEEVGFDRSYISKLFSECEHMTMKEYITYEKIRLVKNMLTYSPYSYSRIAAYFGFSSQSHLGCEFKKVTGMTMKDYRNANAKGEIFG